jgi:hypothetical protein
LWGIGWYLVFFGGRRGRGGKLDLKIVLLIFLRLPVTGFSLIWFLQILRCNFCWFLKMKGTLFSRKFLLRVQKFWPPSWEYFSALLTFSNGRTVFVAVSNKVEDLYYLSRSRGRESSVGCKDLEPILFFLLLFCAWCLLLTVMFSLDPSLCFLLPGGPLWY